MSRKPYVILERNDVSVKIVFDDIDRLDEAYEILDENEISDNMKVVEASQDLDFLIGAKTTPDEVYFFMREYCEVLFAEEDTIRAYVEAFKPKAMKDFINALALSWNYTLMREEDTFKRFGHRYALRSGYVDGVERIDFEKLGKETLESGKGITTKHGLLFENEKKIMDKIYAGTTLPSGWMPENSLMLLKVKGTKGTEYVALPTTDSYLDRAMKRAGAKECILRFEITENFVHDTDSSCYSNLLYLNSIQKLNRILNKINEFTEPSRVSATMKYLAITKIEGIEPFIRNMDKCEFFPDVFGYEALGSRLRVEYDIPDNIYELFGAEEIGKRFCEKNHGVFISGVGFYAPTDEIYEAYVSQNMDGGIGTQNM